MSFKFSLRKFLFCLLALFTCNQRAFASSIEDKQRLYDDLLNGYNRLVRPVINNSEVLTVRFGLKLTQILDVDEKNQILTTNVWLKQEWIDINLVWDPANYNNISTLTIPSVDIWIPDLILFNSVDGNYESLLTTRAKVQSNGSVVWEPPAVFKSSCTINVEFFPFDEQHCLMKFGSWTYDGTQVDLVHVDQKRDEKGQIISDEIPVGIDLKEFYRSIEWDIMSVGARRNYVNGSAYDSHQIPDITFNITLRRKTLFYTVNLIIPCVGISFLTVLTFYLPVESTEKITLCISILVALTVFFLLLNELIPPTSLVVPLIGKYLFFTMLLVCLSVAITVVVLNVHFRSPSTYTMSPWVRRVFLRILPKFLLMRRPTEMQTDAELEAKVQQYTDKPFQGKRKRKGAFERIHNIWNHYRQEFEEAKIIEDWKLVANVIDRLFLWIFTLACILGTCGIILQAPTFYDKKIPIDSIISNHF